LRFEKLIHSLIDNEFVPAENITVLSNKILSESLLPDSFGVKKLVENQPSKNKYEIAYYQVDKFKGLESDVVIYVNESANSFNSEHLDRLRYIAHTRARFFLFELYLEEVK
jgi:DNA helicase IV